MSVIRVVDQIPVRVALNNRQALRHAFADPCGTDLDAARIRPLGVGEQAQQRPIPATDIDHPGIRLDHFRNEKVIDTDIIFIIDALLQEVVALNSKGRRLAINLPIAVQNMIGKQAVFVLAR